MANLSDLSPGFHNLFIRTQNVNGIWSTTYVKSFLIDRMQMDSQIEIQRIEYFVNDDPGFGNGNPLNLNEGASENNFVVTTESLSAGFHTLYMRALNSNGSWSTTYSKSFLIDRIGVDQIKKLVRLEYFINDDPGYGMATSIPLGEDLNIWIIFYDSIGRSALPDSRTCISRALDEGGNWSTTYSKSFLIDRIGVDQIKKWYG